MEQRTTNDIVNKLATKNTDMKGRRCVMAGDAVDPQDYITLNDLNTALDKLGNQSFAPFPAQAHKFLNSVNSNGVFTARQPSFNDISGNLLHSQLPTEALGPTVFDTFWQNGASDGRRAFGAIYQNLKGMCLYVSISFVIPSASSNPGQVTIKFGTDASVPLVIARPGINNNSTSFTVTVEVPVTFFIPPNDYYEVVVTAGSGIQIDQWIEWW